ncbi:FtsQ-type POTRA domain-containing protein [Agromyces soli]
MTEPIPVVASTVAGSERAASPTAAPGGAGSSDGELRRGARNSPSAQDAQQTVPLSGLPLAGRPLVDTGPGGTKGAAGAAASVDAGGAATRGSAVEDPDVVARADPRAARKALAAAERARRRYERHEVRRFTVRSRRRRLAWIVGTGAVVLLVAGVLGAAYSPLMALREVRVEGASRIPAEQLVAAFGDELGTPLPLISSAEVQEALRAFPLIETYSTELVPPGTLIVRVVERTPIGVVQTDDGLELVDAAGVVIDRPAEQPEGQPLIETAGTSSAGFRAAAGVVRALPPEVRGQLARVTAETKDDVRLVLTSGATVVWGSPEESIEKAAVLARLMQAAPPDTVSGYDVSSTGNAVTF